MERDVLKLTSARLKALAAKVGEEIKCPSCGTKHTKTTYHSVFCKSKGGTVCKDNYWNNVDGAKRDNVTRITEARKKWTIKIKCENTIRRLKKTVGVFD